MNCHLEKSESHYFLFLFLYQKERKRQVIQEKIKNHLKTSFQLLTNSHKRDALSPLPPILMGGREQSEKAFCSPDAPCVRADFMGRPLNSATHSRQGSWAKVLRADRRLGSTGYGSGELYAPVESWTGIRALESKCNE